MGRNFKTWLSQFMQYISLIKTTRVPIRFQAGRPVVCRVYLDQDVELEPGTEQLLMGRLDGEWEMNEGSPGVVEGDTGDPSKLDVCVARTVVIPRGGSTVVRLANFLNETFCPYIQIFRLKFT
ncbi:hypothetical protein AC249_AIPGENE24826 [Exaiptasia diaphana]|nr:hypothetical protein AC249_AIPGENE24826 [Exaiptasia diaphana]